MKGTKPKNPCYESRLFREWQFGAGWHHLGVKAGTPKHLNHAQVGKFAILTTRFPNEPESDRRIVGLFQFGEILDEPDSETTLVATSKINGLVTQAFGKGSALPASGYSVRKSR